MIVLDISWSTSKAFENGERSCRRTMLCGAAMWNSSYERTLGTDHLWSWTKDIFYNWERERERVQGAFFVHATSCVPLWIHLYQCCFSFSLLQNLSQVFTSHICCVLCPHCLLTLQCCCHAGQSMLKSDPETVRYPGCQGLKGLRRHGWDILSPRKNQANLRAERSKWSHELHLP